MDRPAAVLTTAQSAVLDEFVRRADAGMPPPSHRELMAVFGWKSPAAARKFIAVLVRKGALRFDAGASRGAYLPSPVVGSVPHIEGMQRDGTPLRVLQTIRLPVQLHPGDPSFAFSVSDDRLRRRGIHKSDLVIARCGASTEPSDLAVIADAGQPQVMTAKNAHAARRKVIGTVRLLVRWYGHD